MNTTVPAATIKTTENDKRKIYEEERYKERQRGKQKTLQEISENYLNVEPEKKTERRPDPIVTSQESYRQLNRRMSAFYESPKEDPQVGELKRKVEALTARLDEKKASPEHTDPMALIEKSYELAAKYYPMDGVRSTSVAAQPIHHQPYGQERTTTVTVRRSADETITTLAAPAALTPEERN